jgi:long-chain acyl-CoA synthetase
MNLANNIETSAFFFPEHTAVRQGGIEWTHAQLNDYANRIATGLIRMGVKPGEHIGLCALNSSEWIAFYFGVLKTGAVAVTLSALLSPGELALLIEHAKPRFVFSSANQLQELERLKSAGGIEKVIGSGDDLDLRHLTGMGAGSFKAIDRDRRSGVTISESYGMTEAMPVTDKNIAPGDLKASLKTRLASFKVPKEFIISGDLPKSPTGKILKRELKKNYLEKGKS